MRDQPAVDTSGQLESVDRTLAVDGDDTTVSVTTGLAQTFPTTLDDLWEAVTTPERLAAWFGVVTGNLRPGGRYAIRDNAEGTIEECTAGRSVSLTWEFGGDVSRLDVRLEPLGERGTTPDGGVRLTLEQVAGVPAGFWRQYGPGAGGVGWDLALLGLAHHLDTGATRPPESTEWMGSPEAHRFVAGASDRWAAASIAAGTDEQIARAAEEATTAFYTGTDLGPDADTDADG